MDTTTPNPDLSLLAYQIGELAKALDKHAEATSKALGELKVATEKNLAAVQDRAERLAGEVADHESRLAALERYGKWGAGVITGVFGLFLKRTFNL